VTGAGDDSCWIISRCAWTLYNFRAGLMRAAREQGLRVVGMGADGDGFDAKIRGTGISFEPLPVDKRGINPVADLKLFVEFYRRMRKRRPALVHLFTIKPVIYGGLAARLAGVPVVVTVTGLGYAFTSANVLLRRIVEFLYRAALRKVPTVFFLNDEDRQLFLHRGLVEESQAKLLPGEGVDTGAFGFIEPKKAGSPVFLMAARLIREKGVEEYIEAARRLRAAQSGIRFILLGAPDERNPTALTQAEIERLTRAAGVEWPGAVDDVHPWLARADVVVLPSYREGVPRSLLEAASMGRALITTDAVGCREVVDPEVNGLLVPVKDIDALVVAMRRFIEKPELVASFGTASREKVVREFDERIVIEKTLRAYGDAGMKM
jgi:glycosyltransferase involved in cell wall biosynthesis